MPLGNLVFPDLNDSDGLTGSVLSIVNSCYQGEGFFECNTAVRATRLPPRSKNIATTGLAPIRSLAAIDQVAHAN
jgi:hypothetical protein